MFSRSVDVDCEDAASRRDEGYFAYGCREGGEELLGELGSF